MSPQPRGLSAVQRDKPDHGLRECRRHRRCPLSLAAQTPQARHADWRVCCPVGLPAPLLMSMSGKLTLSSD